jgi:hypothetical protein
MITCSTCCEMILLCVPSGSITLRWLQILFTQESQTYTWYSQHSPSILHVPHPISPQINTYTVWQGQSQVTLWQEPINVTGFTELGQFVPGHTSHDPYPVFHDDTARVIYLNYSSNSTVVGIAADRYFNLAPPLVYPPH